RGGADCNVAAAAAFAAGNDGERLVDQLGDDLGRALLAADEPDALPSHHRAGLDIPVDDGAAQSAGPEMLDLELRPLLRQLAVVEPVDNLALYGAESFGCRVGEGAHRDHRKPSVELSRRHRIAGRGADERLLESWMRN